MNNIKYNGGPAFPHEDNPARRVRSGMTMRDYFAAAAMQGMMANNWNQNYESWALHAYKLADAMLAERNKE